MVKRWIDFNPGDIAVGHSGIYLIVEHGSRFTHFRVTSARTGVTYHASVDRTQEVHMDVITCIKHETDE